MSTITPVWIDSFGHGRAASPHPYAQITGTISVVTSPVRPNTGHSSKHDTATSFFRYTWTSNFVAAAFYLYFEDVPAGDREIYAGIIGATATSIRFDSATGKLEVSSGGASAVTGGPVIAADTWYRVVFEIDASANPWVFRCQVDDTTEFQTTIAVAAASNVVANFGDGGVLGNTTIFYINSLVLSATNGDYEVMRDDWSSHDVVMLRPTSDGTHNTGAANTFKDGAGTAFTDASTDVWQRLDEYPWDTSAGAGTLQQELTGATNYVEVLFGNLAISGTIEGVRSYATHTDESSTGASLNETRLLLADSTEVLTTGSVSVIESTEDPGNSLVMKSRMTIAPSGGWDGTKVDGLKGRFGFGDGSPDGHLFDYGVDVVVSQAAAGSVNPIIVISAFS